MGVDQGAKSYGEQLQDILAAEAQNAAAVTTAADPAKVPPAPTLDDMEGAIEAAISSPYAE